MRSVDLEEAGIEDLLVAPADHLVQGNNFLPLKEIPTEQVAGEQYAILNQAVRLNVKAFPLVTINRNTEAQRERCLGV